MTPESPSDARLVISYLLLRRMIGYIGFVLPVVLSVGAFLLRGTPLQSSISAYYYTTMRDVFVGMMCATGVFLFSYKGYERKDDIAANLASFCALVVAIFPTPMPAVCGLPKNPVLLGGAVHFVAAGILLYTYSFFALSLFRKTNPDKPMTLQKRQRNRVYTICGHTIRVCLVLIGLNAIYSTVVKGNALQDFNPIFVLETVAVYAFATSWVVKGEAILKDE